MSKTRRYRNQRVGDARDPRSAVERVDIPLRGRRNKRAANNSLQFFSAVEGTTEQDGRLRSANGMRWVLP